MVPNDESTWSDPATIHLKGGGTIRCDVIDSKPDHDELVRAQLRAKARDPG